MTLFQKGDDGKLHPVAFDGRKLYGPELKCKSLVGWLYPL